MMMMMMMNDDAVCRLLSRRSVTTCNDKQKIPKFYGERHFSLSLALSIFSLFESPSLEST